MLLVASCYGNLDRLRPDGQLGSYAGLKLTMFYMFYLPIDAAQRFYYKFFLELPDALIFANDASYAWSGKHRNGLHRRMESHNCLM